MITGASCTGALAYSANTIVTPDSNLTISLTGDKNATIKAVKVADKSIKAQTCNVKLTGTDVFGLTVDSNISINVGALTTSN